MHNEEKQFVQKWINLMNNEQELFQKGIDAFNNHQFYDAHEYWEELWLDHKLTDAPFIQGLIQLAVSYFHYYNGNLKGAKSMAKKCLLKFEPFEYARGIDIKEFKMKPPNSDLLTQLGIASNDKVIITVANLAPIKGIELLLESFEILYKVSSSTIINFIFQSPRR